MKYLYTVVGINYWEIRMDLYGNHKKYRYDVCIDSWERLHDGLNGEGIILGTMRKSRAMRLEIFY